MNRSPSGTRAYRVSVDYWACGYCVEGYWPDGERCLHCSGYGTAQTREGWPEEESVRLPRPPAVMKSPCADCAFRPGSQEREHDDALPDHTDPNRPFYCHSGMPMMSGYYRPTAWVENLPLGYMVCAGWWDWRETGQMPTKECGPERLPKPLPRRSPLAQLDSDPV